MLTALLAILALMVSPVVGLLGFLGFMQLRNHWRYYISGCRVPYVKERPFIGTFRPGATHLQFKKNFEELGPIYYYSFFFLPSISVADPDIVHHVLLKENFPKGSFALKNLQVFWGPNMVSLDHGVGAAAISASPWKHERKMAEPAFKISALRALTDIFSLHAQQFTHNMISMATMTSSQPVDLAQEFAHLTMDILSTSGFGYPLELLNNAEGTQFVKAVQVMLTSIVTPLLVFPFGGHLLKYLHRNAVERVDQTFYKVIDDRLRELEQQNGHVIKEDKKPRDLLDMLLAADENGVRLTKEELRNELLLFYIAGHETTATFLTWFIYSMCLNPGPCQKVYDEIDSVLGVSDGKNLVSPTNEQLEELVYTKMAINETLRMYPPATGVTRKIPETFEMKGHVFPKDHSILCNVVNLHYNPDIWPNPKVFNPERFTKENSEGRHLFAFLPFSAGPRICLGRRFFYNEALTIIATMFREIRFELDTTKENGVPNPKEPVLKPQHVWVHPHRRFSSTKK